MADTEYPVGSEQTFDIRKVITRVLRNWYWVVISIAVAYSLAIMVNRYSDPAYTVSATLIINDERKSTAEMVINALDRFNARKNIENEIAILKSYKMAYRAVSELDFDISYYKKGNIRQSLLYKSAPFKVELDSSANTSIGFPVNITLLSNQYYEVFIEGNLNIRKKLRYGEYFRHASFNFTIDLNNPDYFVPSTEDNYFFIVNDKNSLANGYASKLTIAANERKGTILTLRIVGAVAQMEADYLNKIMEVYIRTGLEEKNQTAINTMNFIDQQLAIVVDSLKIAEDKLQSFKSLTRTLGISEEGQLLFSRITDLQKEKVSFEVELKYYQYLKDYLASKSDFSNVIAPAFIGISQATLSSSLNELIDFYKERKTLLYSATKNNPAIAVIDQKIRSALDALEEGISEAYKNTSRNMKEIDYQLQVIEAEMVQLPSNERKFLNIQRNYKLNDEIYNFLLQKRADAAIAKASNVADNKILDIARPENGYQISPKSSQNKTTGLLLGTLIPIGILILLEFFNTKITEPDDIKRITQIPIIGTIGHNDRDSEIPVSANPQSAIAESFRALRTNLQYFLRDNNKKVICITSTISGEGKTFTAINLAAILAQSNKKTLLLSLDLRKPKIHKVFNMENQVGLSNYLIEKATYEEIIVPTNINNLFISMAGPVPPNPAELIETPRMEEFIHKAMADFDIVILDTPPLAIVTDAMLLSRFASVMIFVVRLNYSTKDVLRLVEELHAKKEVANLGIVINDIKFGNGLYGRKYGYRYGYSYGYGYGKGQGYYNDENEKVTEVFWKRIKRRFFS